MAGRVTNFMRMLKALVIGMGILIVIGSAVIVVKIAQRGIGESAANGDGPVTPTTIALPAGARVIETALDGDRIALRIALEDGGERVMIIDTRSGRRVGAVDLGPAQRVGGAKVANP